MIVYFNASDKRFPLHIWMDLYALSPGHVLEFGREVLLLDQKDLEGDFLKVFLEFHDEMRAFIGRVLQRPFRLESRDVQRVVECFSRVSFSTNFSELHLKGDWPSIVCLQFTFDALQLKDRITFCRFCLRPFFRSSTRHRYCCARHRDLFSSAKQSDLKLQRLREEALKEPPTFFSLLASPPEVLLGESS